MERIEHLSEFLLRTLDRMSVDIRGHRRSAVAHPIAYSFEVRSRGKQLRHVAVSKRVELDARQPGLCQAACATQLSARSVRRRESEARAAR